ncbi:element excision factor XisH family protein [Microcoleus sp. T2B6]|uniref:element excision factor XisH family protein n=1 Tax=Microcoleus sp. T2B6 TaxID=3055424 RepID=UPI002FD351A9
MNAIVKFCLCGGGKRAIALQQLSKQGMGEGCRKVRVRRCDAIHYNSQCQPRSQKRAIVPARDIYHQLVKQALIKAGWTITHDPYPLAWAKRNLSIDLGAEQLLAAENNDRKIAVEVKSFIRESRIADLEQALGQYTLYYDILKRTESERQLYLAIPLNAFTELFEGQRFGQILLDNNRLNLVVFNPKTEEIVQWIA